VRWVLIVVGGLIVLVAIVALVGALLPQSHVASRSRTFAAPPVSVFAAISDVRRYAEWRPGLREVTLLNEEPLRWREVSSDGTIEYERTAADPPRTQSVRITSEGLPFGGRWEYDVAPENGGSRVTITEYGEIYNPIFRTMARFVFGYHKTIEDYLAALDAQLRR
jgi:hypothetical protein